MKFLLKLLNLFIKWPLITYFNYIVNDDVIKNRSAVISGHLKKNYSGRREH